MTLVVFRPAAEADLLAIALHVAEHSPTRARALVLRNAAPFWSLTRSLDVRALGPDLRSLFERPYVLLYRVIADNAEIVAVLHSARDLPAALAARIEREGDA